MIELKQTGWVQAATLLPGGVPGHSAMIGSQEGLDLIRSQGFSTEILIPDNFDGNQRFNAAIANIRNEETVFRPWTTTYHKAERVLYILFTEEADAVMFRLMNV